MAIELFDISQGVAYVQITDISINDEFDQRRGGIAGLCCKHVEEGDLDAAAEKFSL